MNGKQAKRLRRKSKEFCCQFVKDRVLPPDLTEGVKCATLLSVVPVRVHRRDIRGWPIMAGTYRYFILEVKKNPEVTYEEIIESIYGSNEEANANGPTAE